MSLQDDLDHTAVTAATHALAADLPEIPAERLERAAANAVAAARPFVNGTEYAKITANADNQPQ
jgi:hypothetical protein